MVKWSLMYVSFRCELLAVQGLRLAFLTDQSRACLNLLRLSLWQQRKENTLFPAGKWTMKREFWCSCSLLDDQSSWLEAWWNTFSNKEEDENVFSVKGIMVCTGTVPVDAAHPRKLTGYSSKWFSPLFSRSGCYYCCGWGLSSMCLPAPQSPDGIL